MPTPTETTLPAPLKGLKVIELARVLAGPWAGQMLSDLGAEVIKIESESGDMTRTWGLPYVTRNDEQSAAYYHSCNRGKRSIVIDIQSDEGQEQIRQLVSESDVLIENYKTGTLAKYGLDYASLREITTSWSIARSQGLAKAVPTAPDPALTTSLRAPRGSCHSQA